MKRGQGKPRHQAGPGWLRKCGSGAIPFVRPGHEYQMVLLQATGGYLTACFTEQALCAHLNQLCLVVVIVFFLSHLNLESVINLQ